MNVYPFIEAERVEQRNVKRPCVLLEVSRAAFYQWAKHVPSRRKRADRALAPRIKEIHTRSRGTYGLPASTPPSAATGWPPAPGGWPG